MLCNSDFPVLSSVNNVEKEPVRKFSHRKRPNQKERQAILAFEAEAARNNAQESSFYDDQYNQGVNGNPFNDPTQFPFYFSTNNEKNFGNCYPTPPESPPLSTSDFTESLTEAEPLPGTIPDVSLNPSSKIPAGMVHGVDFVFNLGTVNAPHLPTRTQQVKNPNGGFSVYTSKTDKTIAKPTQVLSEEQLVKQAILVNNWKQQIRDTTNNSPW